MCFLTASGVQEEEEIEVSATLTLPGGRELTRRDTRRVTVKGYLHV